MTACGSYGSRQIAPAATVLIRLAVGWVFLSEGIQKFLYPAALGVGRFATIGIPWPEVMAPFVATVEIVCGLLVLLGLGTRPAAALLLMNISVAILSTKLPIFLGHGYWLFSVAKLSRYGFWSAFHEARTDLCIWLGCIFLIAEGPGSLSLDARRLGRTLALALSLASLLLDRTARAGPPFLTDDPDPVETGHWEVYGVFQWAGNGQAASGTCPHVEVNYGALPVAGWLVQRQLATQLTLGAEVFVTVSWSGGAVRKQVNMGLVLDLTEQHHLLLSAGPSFGTDDRAQAFLAYQLTL